MPHISIKRLAYYNGEILLNHNLTPIKSSSWLTKICCASYENLISCNLQEKELSNNTVALNHSHYSPKYTQQWVQTQFLDDIYQYCIKKGVFKEGVGYVFTVFSLQGGVLRVLALEEENAHCDIIVPMLFLPFCLEAKPNGVFLLHNWLMLYHNGELLYDVYCRDFKELKEGLAFLERMYAKKKPQIQYLGGFVERSARQAQNLQELNNNSYLDEHLEIQTLFASADFKKIDSTLERLCFDFVLQDNLAQHLKRNLQAGAHNSIGKDATRPKPIYYQAGNALLQTHSFWTSLKALACCALVCIVPFCKLGYAKYAEFRANELRLQNNLALQTMQQKNIKNELKQLEIIDSTLQSLLALHSPYVPRLEIISSISTIASKNAVWIGNLSLQSNEQENTKNIGLGVYANDEKHIQTFLQELRNISYFAFVDSAEMVQKDDIFMMNISANLL